jgi:hypothetical protein
MQIRRLRSSSRRLRKHLPDGWVPRRRVTLLSAETFMDGLSAARRADRVSEDFYDQERATLQVTSRTFSSS